MNSNIYPENTKNYKKYWVTSVGEFIKIYKNIENKNRIFVMQ